MTKKKIGDLLFKVNELYRILLDPTEDSMNTINVLNSIINDIMPGTQCDNKWINRFWKELLDASKGEKIEFERKYKYLQEEKRRRVPRKLFRFRHILGNEIRYRTNPLLNSVPDNPFLDHYSLYNIICGNCDSNYSEIVKKFSNTSEIGHRMDEIKGKLYCSHVYYQNDPYESLAVGMKPFDNDDETQRIAKSIFSNVLNEMIRKPSFCASFIALESPKSLPMWNHYAENNMGICLEYDTSKWEKWKDAIFPVNYSKKLLGLEELLGKDGISLPMPHTIIPFLTLKLLDWSYEHEWRIIVDANLLRNLDEDKYEFVKNKRFTISDGEFKKYFKDPYLLENQIYNDKFQNSHEMQIIGVLLKDFPKPSKIYFPDIYHNMKYSYVDKGDLIYISAQRELVKRICKYNEDSKEEQIELMKLQFTINGIEFEPY